MLGNKLKGLDKTSLRRWLWLFFLILAIPTGLLIYHSSSQLKWEAYHQHQRLAETLSQRIEQQINKLIEIETQRPFTDYAFLNVVGDPKANYLQRSPLSQFPVNAAIPGAIGYFQVDMDGQLQTPLLPEAINTVKTYGIDEGELTQRLALQSKIALILSENRLVNTQQVAASLSKPQLSDLVIEEAETTSSYSRREVAAPKVSSSSKPYAGQSVFDDLKSRSSRSVAKTELGRLEDLKLEQRFKSKEELSQKQLKKSALTEKKRRIENSVLPEPIVQADDLMEADLADAIEEVKADMPSTRIRTFESEVDRFEFSQLASGHFVLFRKVWLNDQRYIQGILLEKDTFLDTIIQQPFSGSVLSQTSKLLVVQQGSVVKAYSGNKSRSYQPSTRGLKSELLYQTKLSEPFSDMQLVYSITALPVGPGGTVILWLALVLSLVLCGGFYLLYRLGVGQLNLVHQQQDFVSAVSHELKTPLTSIRLYGDMLQQGWATEEKKKTYYDFIVDESERLSRLINNVLLMAKMTRNTQQAQLKKLTVSELLDGVQSKVSTQIERAGFELKLNVEQSSSPVSINVDPDWFSQIFINLVDNALKFSAKSERKIIELNAVLLSSGKVEFTLRDHGPGIARDQLKKIFKLFYRSENELTRETVGTGIGLALVQQMTVNMQGQIDVTNQSPGAAFTLVFPVVK